MMSGLRIIVCHGPGMNPGGEAARRSCRESSEGVAVGHVQRLWNATVAEDEARGRVRAGDRARGADAGGIILVERVLKTGGELVLLLVVQKDMGDDVDHHVVAIV